MITLYDDSPMAALLNMIERLAPALMKQAGGALTQERASLSQPVTPARRARVVALARAGLTMRQIQEETGVSVGYAWRIATEAGVVLRRKGRR